MKKVVFSVAGVILTLYLLNLGLAEFYRWRVISPSMDAASLAEAFTLASPAKTYVMEFYFSQGHMPDSNQELGIGEPETLAGRWVEAINIGPNGVIDLSLKDVGESAHIYLQPEEQITGLGSRINWRCYARGLERSLLNTIHSPVCTLLSEAQPLPVGMEVKNKEQKGAETPVSVENLVDAINSRHRSLVKSLIARGADVNGRNRLGESPLQAAIVRGDSAMVQDLIAAGANVNEVLPDPDARTLLMHAAEKRSYGATKIRALLAAGARLEARSASGKTPLMVAVIANDNVAVGIFLELGAVIDAVDKKGKSASDYAIMMHGQGSSIYRSLESQKDQAKEFIYRLPES